jgi:flavin-dependent dehydrogenase
VVIDGSHPREKPCGGGISARALDLLRHLPAGWLQDPVDVQSARFSSGRVCADVPLARGAGDSPALVIASRQTFDAALLDAAIAAGAEHVARRVVSFDRCAGGWSIATDTNRLTSAWLVGADGANSLVRRRVLGSFPRADLSVASGYYVQGASGKAIDIEFVETPPGYLWSFPRRDHLAVGVCGQADGTSSSELFRASAEWIGRRYGREFRLARYSWPIPSLTGEGLRAARPSGEGWMLIGDAAGLVDPITREGIFFALQSAELAARSLQGRDPAGTYTRAIRSTIHKELAKAARIKERFFQPAFYTLLVRSLQRSRRIGAIMTDLVAGRQTYDGLRRRLLFTGEWRLALEYLRLWT